MKKIAVLLTALLLLSACQTSQQEQNPGPEADQREGLSASYEVTEDDIFDLWESENFTSWNVSVMGVELNDSRRQVISEMGSPDNFTMWEGGGVTIQNLEYDKSLGLNRTGLIFHLENGRVTRITVNDEFNEYLINDTVVNGTKEDIYFSIGTPDSRNTVYKYIAFNYNDRGLQILTFRGDEMAFSLIPPRPTDRTISENNTEKVYYPYREEIKLQ